MSQTVKKGVLSKILVRNKNPGTISTGANTEVLLDGKPLKGVSYLKLEFKPRNVTKVVLEMYAEVEVETETFLDLNKQGKDLVQIGKKIYTLSEYQTVGVGVEVKPNSDIVDPSRNNVT